MPEMVGRAERRNPRRLLFELIVLRRVEPECQGQGNEEPGEGRQIGAQLDGARIRRRNEQQHQKSHQRREQDY